MFRRRDEDEIEYTLQPVGKNPASANNSGFHAANQAPGQMINSQPVTPPQNIPHTPYNPAASHNFAQNLAQAQQRDEAPPVTSYRSSQAAPSQETQQTPKENKTSTPKTAATMNTFVPSAIRASSNQAPAQSQQPQAQQQPAQQSQQQAPIPKQQPLKVDNIGLETERRLTVGYGISLEGKVSDCDKLVIYGNVNAELNNVKALQISDSGTFRGAAEIDYAEISGIFEGEIRVRKNIVISSTGRVSGKITYSSIEIKPGGKFTGEIIEAKTDYDTSSNSENEGRTEETKPNEGFNLFPEQKTENRAA